MMFGLVLVVVGYATFYWGLHHMPHYKHGRYSLWALLGFGTLFKNLSIPAEEPVQWTSKGPKG
jgi:hypothetical protein